MERSSERSFGCLVGVRRALLQCLYSASQLSELCALFSAPCLYRTGALLSTLWVVALRHRRENPTRTDAGGPRVVGHAVDSQHVGGRACIYVVVLGVLHHVVEARHHHVREALVDDL